MTALSAARNTPQRTGDIFAYPVSANTTCYQGGIAVLRGGYAEPASTATGLIAVGRFEATAVNGTDTDGAAHVQVRTGVFKFANSASGDLIAQADVGANCYLVDDQTVAKTNGSNTRSIAGKVVAVEPDGVWVRFAPEAADLLSAGNPAREGDASRIHHATHFHGFAGLQFAGDTKFYDMAAGNHGGFGAHLSVANAWAQAGYVSSLDPATGATDSVIRIPPLNFDYAGGQKLIVWWLGAASPEASDATLMGDCPFAQAAVGGVRIRAKSTGKADLVLYGSGSISRYGGASSATVFDGTLHSFALALDGGAKKYGMWCDEVYEPVFGAQYSSFSTGAGADTRSTNTWNLGAASAAPGGTEGMATKTRGLLIMRLQAHEAMPSVATLTNLFKQLRANPSRTVSDEAF